MVQYLYDSLLFGTSTKPVEIYRGNEKIGVVRGFYKNTIMKILDHIMKSASIINYELKDDKGNIRILSKDVTGLGKKKVLVQYFDNDGKRHEILIKDVKTFDIGENVSLEYKGQTYYINKKPFKPAELIFNE